MNILLTSVGRQVQLARGFKAELGGRGSLLASDCRADAPALKDADFACILPPPHQPGYVDALLELCVCHQVRLLVPLSMAELPALAQNRARFLNVGTLPLVASAGAVYTCYDRIAMDEFLREWEIGSPKSYGSVNAAKEGLKEGDLVFPAVVKPRWGGDLGQEEVVYDAAEMDWAFSLMEKRLRRVPLPPSYAHCGECPVLVQQRVLGQSYDLEVLNDLEGRYVATFIKRTLNTHYGQTERAVVESNPQLECLGMVLGQKLGHVGMLSARVVVTRREIFVLGLRPLVGPDVNLTQAAGLRLPAILMAWLNGEQLNPKWLGAEQNVMVAYGEKVEVVGRSRPTRGDGQFLLMKC